MKKSFFCKIMFLFLFFSHCLEAHSIVFVHIGSELPQHLLTTLKQARLFNQTCPIFLIANEQAFIKFSSKIEENNVEFISCESLIPSSLHYRFQNHPGHEQSAFGLWKYSLERFFYLEEFIREYNAQDIFHLESDVMLYTDLADILPIFKQHYKGMIGATFEDDFRCVPGFMYISDLEPIKNLINIFPEYGRAGQSDMEALASFKNQYHKIFVDHLPVIPPEYVLDYPLKAQNNERASGEPEFYSTHFLEFNVIFDAAAFGVYLAGFDSRFHPPTAIPGIITPWCVFNPSLFDMGWEVDEQGRRVPIVSYKHKKIPIVNLHITNKSVINDYLSLN